MSLACQYSSPNSFVLALLCGSCHRHAIASLDYFGWSCNDVGFTKVEQLSNILSCPEYQSYVMYVGIESNQPESLVVLSFHGAVAYF